MQILSSSFLSVSKSFGCKFSTILVVTHLSIYFRLVPKVLVVFMLYFDSLKMLLPFVFRGVKWLVVLTNQGSTVECQFEGLFDLFMKL